MKVRNTYLYTKLQSCTHTRGGTQKFPELWKEYLFKIVVWDWNCSPLWLDAAIPALLLLLETFFSKIFNRNAVKGRQWLLLNLYNVSRIWWRISIKYNGYSSSYLIHTQWGWLRLKSAECLPFKSCFVPGGGIIILFSAKREAFCWCCWGSVRIAGGPWQHFHWRIETVFPAVGAALGSLCPIKGGVLWRGIKFQTCLNILNKFFFNNSGNFGVPISYIAQ
jgi:hypothetical protein